MATNTEPAGADRSIALVKNGAHVFAAADFGFSDADGNSLLAVKISTLPGAGQLLLNGSAVNAGDFVSAADIGAGLLQYVPAPNGNGTAYASFAFQVQDDGGTNGGGIDLDQTPNTITFNVSAVINGDSSDNLLAGTSDHETIDGKAGNDTFFGILAGDTLIGGDGNDTYILSDNVPLSIIEGSTQGSGIDTITSTISRSLLLYANVENLTLRGNAAIDGTGNELANRIDGSQCGGANVLTGLGGNDTYIVGAGDTVVEAAGGGIDIVGAAVSYTLAANVETLVLIGPNPITGTGNAMSNTLDGSQNSAANVLKGLAGDDTYFIGAGDTVVEAAGGGTDLVKSYVSHTLAANVENLVLLGNAAISGTGNGLGNRLDGAANPGANVLKGLAGNDIYIVGAGDTVIEAAGAGTDIVGTGISYTLTANVETLVLIGNKAVAGTGNGLANVLDGSQNSAANVLKGLAGNDTYFVGAGDVVVELAGGGTSDVVRSLVSYRLGANVEHLVLMSTTNLNGTGNSLANTIEGNAGNNILNGGAGGDTLKGMAGNDVLIGGAGQDVLAGGTGNDVFVLNAPLSKSNIDAISDFNHIADTFRLENGVMKALGGAGALKAGFFFAGHSAHDADDHIIYDRTTGGLFYDDDGIGGHAQVQIAYLGNKPLLAANDFQVI
jgi:Ca2+-binding RTX toxin-like protein